MKGLSLTMEIVIIAIVLLVTALVVMTIFSGQMGSIMTILGIWSSDTMQQNFCRQKCAAWCQVNIGKTAPSDNWNSFTIEKSDVKCSTVMAQLGSCSCSLNTADK